MNPEPASVGASIAVSDHGHFLFALRQDDTMTILHPRQRVETIAADIGVLCGLYSGVFTCDTDTSVSGGFRASFAELESFIEDAVSATGTQNERLQSHLASILKRADSQEVSS